MVFRSVAHMHLSQARPLLLELRRLRQIHLVPPQCSWVYWGEKGPLLSPLPWSSTMLCQLEHQIQALDDCGSWQKCLHILLFLYLHSHSQEAETISPALESGLGLWLALTNGMRQKWHHASSGPQEPLYTSTPFPSEGCPHYGINIWSLCDQVPGGVTCWRMTGHME